MSVNVKKPLKLRNNTKRFNPSRTRIYNTFASPETYSFRCSKTEGYEARLYWQFKYCEDHGGQTYFYTLTYNDKALPKYYGQPCFDYEDLRDLLTGGFRKQLLRRYGTTFKYFIGAELGDGKGERGMHRNPHYHVLFFLEDAHNPRYPYKVIGPRAFRHLVRMYWQGFDEALDGYRDYNTAKYGIAREGEPIGVRQPVYGKVLDFRACVYCAKYVCKDADLKANEKHFISRYRGEFNCKIEEDFNFMESVYKRFFDEVLFPLYAYDYDTGEVLFERPVDLLNWFVDEFVNDYDPLPFEDPCPHLEEDSFFYFFAVDGLVSRLGMQRDLRDFMEKVREEYVHERLTEYRNRYCNKCRISQGVGDYALKDIDPMEPCIPIPCKDGFHNRPLSLYYFRKLYCDVVKDEDGTNLYILNELGREYSLHVLPRKLQKKASRARMHLELLLSSPELFEKMRESDVNTEVFFHYEDFLMRWYYLLNENNIENILERYAQFKLIYEDRFFPMEIDGCTGRYSFPRLDPLVDYERFLVPTFYDTPCDRYRLTDFLESDCQGYMSYNSHPYFLRYLGIFALLDTIADYLFVQKDNRDQKKAEERARVKRFHDQRKLKEFYAFFK